MRLDILSPQRRTRARRAAVVVTDQESGDAAARQGSRGRRPIRCASCSRRICASARAAWRRRPRASVFLTVHVPPPRLVVIGAVHISQALAPIARAARLRRDHRRSAHRVRVAGALSRREGDRRMARHGAAAARRRPLHGLRRAHARSEDRRSGAAARARARLLLYRRARLAEDARPPRRAAEGAGRRATAALARIHAPIGLPIGAVSPPEIAVAIMGEITRAAAARRRRRKR